MFRKVFFVLAVAMSVLAAGCGGGDDGGGDGSTSTADWANGVCSAISTWTSSISTATESLRSSPTQEGLQSAVDDVKSATQTFADDLKSLGKPDTESGQEAKDSLDKLADDLQTDMQQIESDVDEASGVSGLVTAVTAISTTLATMGTQITSTFQGLENLDASGDLEEAFQQADSCKSLSQS
jgi:phage-related protein